MKKYTSILAAAVLSLAAASANAIVIDFAALANDSGEYGIQPLSFDIYGNGSVTLSIYGYNADGETHAYLDKTSGGRVGGLGVCTTLDHQNQCDPANDDNVTEGEYLKFVFTGAPATINSISFNNNHDGGFAAGASILVGGNTFNPNLGYGASTMLDPFSGAFVTEFMVAYDNSMFYVESIDFEVPEPAGLALLGLGLLGFGAARRAKR